MPNAFTPNNDGINDCFGLKYWGNVTKLDFSIYNRFGERIFYTTDPAKCWDGRYKGVLHKVIKADGPERIEQEWWMAEGQHRDYYAVEDEEGRRYWLFRSGHYTAEKLYQWFLHGFFA